MDAGLDKIIHFGKLKFYELTQQVAKASALAVFAFVVSIIFLILSFWVPALLAIVGSFLIVSAGVFNNDIQRYDSYVRDEVKKAEVLNELQSYLLSVIRDFGAVRANYERSFSEKNPNKFDPRSFKRPLVIPYIPIVPVFDSENVRKIFSKLTFTVHLFDEGKAKKLHEAPESEQSKSLTYLAYHLENPEKLVELWRVRNDFLQRCPKRPNNDDYRLLSIAPEDIESIQTLDNYFNATDYCLIQTDEILHWAQLALDNFIPEAKQLIAPDALKKCTIPSMSGSMYSPDFVFKELIDEEREKRHQSLMQKVKEITAADTSDGKTEG